jgi:hypothetical protein
MAFLDNYWTHHEEHCVSAVYPGVSPILSTLSVAATPFSPFLMSTANTLAMEAKFLQRAQQNPKLRQCHRAHLIAGGAGLALFALDEMRPNIPGNHAAWHVLSCYAVHQTLPLIADSQSNP